jgi:hypothetical protein
MICWSFSESKGKKLMLGDVARRTFIKTLDVWCGREGGQEVELCEVQELTSVADRFQITEITSFAGGGADGTAECLRDCADVERRV